MSALGMGIDRTSLPLGTDLALVFTDARGRVVFVDNNFLDLLNLSQPGTIVNQPLHQILHVDRAIITQLINDVAQTGYVHQRPLTLKVPEGSTLPILCTAVATRDSEGNFIGADLTLCCDDESTTPETPMFHADVLYTRVKQIQSEAETLKTLEEQARLQLYFTAQVNALQVLLGRMGGPRVQGTMEEIVNQTAKKNAWPIHINGGHFTADLKDEYAAVYLALLTEVIDYAASVIGRRAVQGEMQAVEEQMDTRSLQVADDCGLRSFLKANA